MSAELVFESRSSLQVLRQEGATEIEPFITLQLELTSGPKIYVSGTAAINNWSWSMAIHRHGRAMPAIRQTLGGLTYVAEAKQSRCTIEVKQSPERYADLLDMFRGGHVSEITMLVDGLDDRSDFSKLWDLVAVPSLTIRSLCFEFPLPQSEA